LIEGIQLRFGYDWQAIGTGVEMMFDTDESPPNEGELVEVLQSARQLLRHRRNQAVYATAAFFLSCASVSPFLEGHSLHTHWESFGKYLVLLSMGLLLVFVFYVGRAFNAWLFVRDVEKIDS
jgi:hypothetical protein